MASLQGTKIKNTYPGLLKTDDNGVVGATEKRVTDGQGNATNMTIGTGGTSFDSGTVDFTGATVSGLPADVNTTYDLASAQNVNDVDVTLTGSDASVDTVKLVAGTNITLTDSGANAITIAAAGGGSAGLVSGTGTDSMKNADSLVTTAATASGACTIVIGNGASATSCCSIVFGNLASAGARESVVIGASATGGISGRAVAVGQQAAACGSTSVALGRNAYAQANFSVALGAGIQASKAFTTTVCQLETCGNGCGITMHSPNGTEYVLTVSDAGALVIT